MSRITDKQLSHLKTSAWISESFGKGHGTFLARKTGDGVQFYFRYTLLNGKRDTIKIGSYSQLSLKAGREECQRLSTLHRQHPNLRAWQEEEAHREQELLRQEQKERKYATFAALLDGYVSWLEQKEKASAKQVRGAIKRHILEPWPELASSKANSLTKRDLSRIISRLIEAGKGREAAKLRA